MVCERKLFLYQLGGGCLDTYILKPNEGAPVRSASSSEENSRFYVGSEDGTISYFKVTNAAINFETKITTPHEVYFYFIRYFYRISKVTCMAAGTEELVTCDSQGCIYSWDIQFATPTLNWQLVISPAMSSHDFSCVCLTSESAIIGTFAGEIIVVQKGKVLCSINAHSGAVSAITVKHNAAVSPQANTVSCPIGDRINESLALLVNWRRWKDFNFHSFGLGDQKRFRRGLFTHWCPLEEKWIRHGQF